MDSTENSSHGPQEITVTCKQCGSTGMERLDHHEYKCTHCGAITVVSDDDANQLESMLGDFLKNSGGIGQTRAYVTTTTTQVSSSGPVPTTNPSVAPETQAAETNSGDVSAPIKIDRLGLTVFLVWLAGLIVLYSFVFKSETKTPPANETVPSETLTLTNRFSMDGVQVATLTNTSKRPIDLPAISMTSYMGDFKKGITSGDVGVSHLLPNEHTTAVFPMISDIEASRFDFTTDGPLPVSSAILPHMQLMQEKLLHVAGSHHYILVGAVQNPLKQDLQSGSIAITLFNAKHEIIGWGKNSIGHLDPSEKTAITVGFDLDESHGQITSYEYLIDM